MQYLKIWINSFTLLLIEPEEGKRYFINQYYLTKLLWFTLSMKHDKPEGMRYGMCDIIYEDDFQRYSTHNEDVYTVKIVTMTQFVGMLQYLIENIPVSRLPMGCGLVSNMVATVPMNTHFASKDIRKTDIYPALDKPKVNMIWFEREEQFIKDFIHVVAQPNPEDTQKLIKEKRIAILEEELLTKERKTKEDQFEIIKERQRIEEIKNKPKFFQQMCEITEDDKKYLKDYYNTEIISQEYNYERGSATIKLKTTNPAVPVRINGYTMMFPLKKDIEWTYRAMGFEWDKPFTTDNTAYLHPHISSSGDFCIGTYEAVARDKKMRLGDRLRVLGAIPFDIDLISTPYWKPDIQYHKFYHAMPTPRKTGDFLFLMYDLEDLLGYKHEDIDKLLETDFIALLETAMPKYVQLKHGISKLGETIYTEYTTRQKEDWSNLGVPSQLAALATDNTKKMKPSKYFTIKS